MNPVVIPNPEMLAWLTTLTATGGNLHGAIMHLFQNNVAITPAIVLANLTECTFTGYTAGSAITWLAPFYTVNGTPVVTGTLQTFGVGSTPTIFNTVYGWYLTDTGGTTLLAVRALDTPIILTEAGQGFQIIPCYPAYVSQ